MSTTRHAWRGWGATTTLCSSQETLNNLRQAMRNTKIMCAVMLDTKVCRWQVAGQQQQHIHNRARRFVLGFWKTASLSH